MVGSGTTPSTTPGECGHDGRSGLRTCRGGNREETLRGFGGRTRRELRGRNDRDPKGSRALAGKLLSAVAVRVPWSLGTSGGLGGQRITYRSGMESWAASLGTCMDEAGCDSCLQEWSPGKVVGNQSGAPCICCSPLLGVLCLPTWASVTPCPVPHVCQKLTESLACDTSRQVQGFLEMSSVQEKSPHG